MAKPILNFLDPGLLQRAQLAAQLTSVVRDGLSPSMKCHVWVADITREMLKLITDDPHFVPFLHFHRASMLQQVNSACSHCLTQPLTRVRIAIAWPTPIPERPSTAPAASLHGSHHMAAAARSVDNPALAQALLKLAKRLAQQPG